MRSQTLLPFDDVWSTLDEPTDGDYYTHPKMIGAFRSAVGQIDLDPASCKEANLNVQAAHFYDKDQDGLRLSWWGRVWLNPPFGEWEQWAAKAIGELGRNVTEMGVFVTANAATTQAFHKLLMLADAVFIPNGRYDCWGPKSSRAFEGNLIFYFGPNRDKFREAFSPYGTVFYSSS